MSEDTKKPHPLSKEGRALREQEKGSTSGDLQEKLEAVKQTTNTAINQAPEFNVEAVEEKVSQNKVQEVAQEASVPLSVVQAMIDAALKNNPPAPQIIQQVQAPVQQQQPKQEFDIEDIPEFRDWEVKDREYEYIDGKPISASIPSQHTALIPLQYFNKETNSVHILRYSTNQPSFFVEKQSKEPGSVVLAEIIFSYGKLRVPASEVNLQKFLHIHQYKDVIFKEYDPTAKSKKTISDKRLRNQAESLVWQVGEITNRAIASLVCPSYVESWIPELLEEEILAYAEKEPAKYIAYTEDPTIKMKGVVKSALFSGDLIYENYRWLNKRREVILEVAKNKDEMDAIVNHFESGVGRSFYEYLLNL